MIKYYPFLLSLTFFAFLSAFFTLNTIFAQTTSNSTTTVSQDDLETNDSGAIITRPDQVVTESDLQIFADNIEILNEKISEVTATTNPDGSIEISVSYVQPGRFLGLFPANLKIINTVYSTPAGIPEVDSKSSFWSGLVSSGNTTNIDYSSIETRIKNNQVVLNETKVNATPQAKARIIEAVVSELNKLEL